MKPILLAGILFLSVSGHAQSSIARMDECSFFALIDQLIALQPGDPVLKGIRTDWFKRRAMLQRLETYLIVFAKDSIAPMYYSDSDSLKCMEYVRQYKSLTSDTEKQCSTYDARALVQKGKYRNILPLLLELTDLNKPEGGEVEKSIAEFKWGFTMEYLYQHLTDQASQNKTYTLSELPTAINERNLELLAKRMDKQDQANHVYYTSYNSKPAMLKGFEIYHDNDVFVPGMNQDREYTGGFKFIAITDYLKWRWLRLSNKKKDDVLTYQTVSLGGCGYTPYIRYRNNFGLADTLHSYDRPFASNFYWERAKHRTWRTGLARHRGEFQVGAIGISQGRHIQAKLHADVIHESQFVYGWDKQISDGGRLFIQANHKLDLLLFSTNNRYQTIFRPKDIKIKEPKNYSGKNIIGELEFKTGTLVTSVGTGIRFSTLDFLKQSGNNMILSKPNSRKDAFGWKLDIGLNYKYVVHNSMLEGIGWLKTFKEDQYDKVRADYYVLKHNEIERNMFILDFGVNLKWRKTTLFFRQNYHTLEYRSRLEQLNFQDSNITARIDPSDIDFYNDTVIKEQEAFLGHKFFGKVIYGFGTIGGSWIIE